MSPDVTRPTACQPTSATSAPCTACRAQGTLDPQAFGRRGTRTRTWAAAVGLLSVRSIYVVIDVSSWWVGRQARPNSASPRQDGRPVRRTDGSQMEKVWRLLIAPQGSWRISGGSATSVDHVLEMLPVDVDTLETCRSQVIQLLVKGDHVAHVVLVARLLLRRAMEAFACRIWVVVIVHSFPAGLDNGIRRAHRVIVGVPAARGEALEDLGEQALLSVIGQVVDAHRGHHRVDRCWNRRRPAAGRHVELDVLEAPRERLHLALAFIHHLR